MIWRLITDLILALAIAYVLFGAYMFFFQTNYLYFPTNQDFNDCSGFKDYKKTSFNGTRFYLLEKSKSAIVYYHGNAGSACDRSSIKEEFEKSNRTVIFVEYAGYSNHDAKPSAELILKDASNIHGYLHRHKYKDVVVCGMSVGASPASYHASLGNVNKLCLLAPFDSLKNLAQSKYPIYPVGLLLRENFDNEKMLKDYSGDILILHGSKDVVVPAKFSGNLYSTLSAKRERIVISGFGHNNLWESDQMKEEFSKYISKNI